MTKQNPYNVVKHRHITEKASMLQGLQNATSNRCVQRFELPKYVFIVDTKATKPQISKAVEMIYADRNVKVVSVNTINVKGKARRVRGRSGRTSDFKKAIVTLQKGDTLDDI
jgi:large subunit ribosomal protein L23